ncbi:CvpA family protein [Seonamhaeicola aphaedonensis]|uniref:Membrane protein required for colicin V production n=1 Tax=Seonamhaeicola aphaedonensis TaxID=1461338 RepID=A0A3D9HH32_9FLAO|nr:CvpA family protein [Seonamhaeicola aphaedonensis]RED48764.1 membrane protein required for colicin V production [Seonamhaeicola aphaedonensis]
MGVIDIILGALILYGFIRGLMKGLFVEIASLVALVAGVWGAIHFSNFAADYLVEKVDWELKYINIVAFTMTFVVIVVVIFLAGKALTKIADFVFLGFVNKILGGVFGALKIAAILSVILIVFDKFNKSIPFANEDDLENSILYTHVKAIVPVVLPYILEFENKESTKTDNDVMNNKA